jgi:hypothetical protein
MNRSLGITILLVDERDANLIARRFDQIRRNLM